MINFKELKAYIFYDNNNKSLKIKKSEKNLKLYKKSNIIIVIGGDDLYFNAKKK